MQYEHIENCNTSRNSPPSPVPSLGHLSVCDSTARRAVGPAVERVKWVQGRGVVVQEQEGVRVAVAYDRNVEERIAFRLEVVNQSATAVLVDPRQLVCSYCRLYPRARASALAGLNLKC